jgi:hypothetical protein
MKSNKMLMCLFMFCVLILGTGLCRANGQKSGETRALANQDTISSILNQVNPFAGIDSLLVIHFHPEVQCSCCIKVGIYAKEGLEKFYAKPYKGGRIIFKEYNIDEDSSTAKKYKIFWSALGFEKFSGGRSEFKEIESVWEFCEDKEKFLPNFKSELDKFVLGDSKNKHQPESTKQKEEKPKWKKPKRF